MLSTRLMDAPDLGPYLPGSSPADPAGPSPVRVAVVDDADAFRFSLVRGLQHCKGIQVVGSACCVEEALDNLEEWAPDAILMDIRMPGMGGIEGTRRVKAMRPEIRVAMLSAFDDPELIRRGLEAGAHAYLVKGCPLEEIAAAARGAPLREPAGSAPGAREA